MLGRRSKLFGWVLLLTFVLGGFFCFLECNADECDDDAPAQSCAQNCLCHGASVLPPSVHVAWGIISQPAAPRVWLQPAPVFCADIFQPPRA